MTREHVTLPGRAGGAGWMVTDILSRCMCRHMKNIWTSPFLLIFETSLQSKYRRPRSRFDIMQSIMANITFPFALPLSFPPNCMPYHVSYCQSQYLKSILSSPTKTARSYMGQSYRLVQALCSVGKKQSHVTHRATQEIRYILCVSASTRVTLADDCQGTVVRLTPNLLSISDPQMLPNMYHRYADKSEFYIHGVMGERAPTFQILGHQEHAERRKIIAPRYVQNTIQSWIGRSRLGCGNLATDDEY